MTANPREPDSTESFGPRGSMGFLVFSWLFVGLPLAWGVYQTLLKSMALFQ
jgi:hypothetical protein